MWKKPTVWACEGQQPLLQRHTFCHIPIKEANADNREHVLLVLGGQHVCLLPMQHSSDLNANHYRSVLTERSSKRLPWWSWACSKTSWIAIKKKETKHQPQASRVTCHPWPILSSCSKPRCLPQWSLKNSSVLNGVIKSPNSNLGISTKPRGRSVRQKHQPRKRLKSIGFTTAWRHGTDWSCEF